MSKFYPASKNSTNPLKDINSDSFVPPEAQIAFATKYKYLPTADLYGSLGDCTILSNGTGIPYNTQLIFPEPTISGGILASGTPIFGLSNYSINIIDGGSGHYIGDNYYIFHDNSYIPSVLSVSATGINGEVSAFKMLINGENYVNDTEIRYSLETNSLNAVAATLEFVNDQYSIVDINIHPNSNGYKVFSSNKLKSKIPYFITTTNNNYGFIAYSTVGPITVESFQSTDTSNFINRNNRFDENKIFKYILFTDPEIRPTTNTKIENLEIIYPTISVLNNQTIYSYTTSCVDDSDCSFCASGVLISNAGSCGGFICEEYGSMINPADPCPEGWEGSNGICSKYTQAASCEECNYGIAPEGMTDYGTGCSEGEPCYEKCCPEGSTGVFPAGDPRSGRCCEDCSETSIEEGQSGWLLTEGYCVDGQCSETPASTGVIPSGENPANTGCIENLPENSGNPTFTFDIDPNILLGLGGLGLGAAFDESQSVSKQLEIVIKKLSPIFEKWKQGVVNVLGNDSLSKDEKEKLFNASSEAYRKWARAEINKLIQKRQISVEILRLTEQGYGVGSEDIARQLRRIIKRHAQSLGKNISEEKIKDYIKNINSTLEVLRNIEREQQGGKNANDIDKQRQKQEQQKKSRPFDPTKPPPGAYGPPPKDWPYGQEAWDRFENNRVRRERCFGFNLDNAQYKWKGMSQLEKRRLISRSLIGLIAGGSLLAYQMFARGGEYEDETINEIVDWIDFIGQADPSTPWIDTLIGSQLGDATFEEYMATAEQLLGGLIAGQITQEQINEILNSMDSVTRNKIEQSMKIKMGIDSESPLSDAIDKANEYKQTIEELSDSDAINNALPDIQFNDENPYDYLYDEEGNFKPLEEILPPSADESEDCNNNCYEKDNSYSYLRAKPKPTIPVSMEYPVLKANEFYG